MYAMAPTVSPSYSPSRTMSSNDATPPEEPVAPLILGRPAPTPAAHAANPGSPAKSTANRAGAKVRLASAGYKVKKGDTLFGIARSKYGDGKKWMQIASANPGLSPQSLKIGQTIVLP